MFQIAVGGGGGRGVELMIANHSTRSGGIIGIFLDFLSYEGMLIVCSH